MKILLIGHSIIDHFEGLEAKESKPGGIFYSTIGINSIIKKKDQIFLLTCWNKKSFHLFEKLYSKVNLDFSNEIEDLPSVLLKTSGSEEREEVYKNMAENLSIEKIADWNKYSGILINMITGFDISLDQLRFIREKFNGPIYFDVHTLSRGTDENLRRDFRLIPNVNEWLSCIDVLQCNENELKTIVQYKSEIESAKKILSMGPKILIITKGDDGAQVYSNINGDTNNYCSKGINISTKNKVGCGDIFGAVFFYTYISTNDIINSLNKANKAGAIAASRNDLTTNPVIELNDR